MSRYIDADALTKRVEDYGEPTRYCTWHESVVNADDFCSYGERSE